MNCINKFRMSVYKKAAQKIVTTVLLILKTITFSITFVFLFPGTVCWCLVIVTIYQDYLMEQNWYVRDYNNVFQPFWINWL